LVSSFGRATAWCAVALRLPLGLRVVTRRATHQTDEVVALKKIRLGNLKEARSRN